MKSTFLLSIALLLASCEQEDPVYPAGPPTPQIGCGFIDTPPDIGYEWHFELMDHLNQYQYVEWTVNGLPEGTGGGMNAYLYPGNTYLVRATITYTDTVTVCEETIVP